MKTVDELMKMAVDLSQKRANPIFSADDMSLSYDALRTAITAALSERDARIAELEAHVSRLHKALAEREAEIKGLERENTDLESQVVGQVFPHAPVIAVTPDDDRRFVDEAAMRVYVRLAEVNDSCDEANAKWAYDTAEALLAEKKRREQR